MSKVASSLLAAVSVSFAVASCTPAAVPSIPPPGSEQPSQRSVGAAPFADEVDGWSIANLDATFGLVVGGALGRGEERYAFVAQLSTSGR